MAFLVVAHQPLLAVPTRMKSRIVRETGTHQPSVDASTRGTRIGEGTAPIGSVGVVDRAQSMADGSPRVLRLASLARRVNHLARGPGARESFNAPASGKEFGSPVEDVSQRMLKDPGALGRLRALQPIDADYAGLCESLQEYEAAIDDGALDSVWACTRALRALEDLMVAADAVVSRGPFVGGGDDDAQFYAQCEKLQMSVRLERISLVTIFSQWWRGWFSGLQEHERMIAVREETAAHERFVGLLAELGIDNPQANLNRLSLVEYRVRYNRQYGHDLPPEGNQDSVFDLTRRATYVPQDDRGLFGGHGDADARNDRFFYIGTGIAYTFHMSTCTALAMYCPVTGLSYLKHADAATSQDAIAGEVREFLGHVRDEFPPDREEGPWDSIETTLYLGSTAQGNDPHGSARGVMTSLDQGLAGIEGLEAFFDNIEIVEGQIESDPGSYRESYVVVGGGQEPEIVESGHGFTGFESALAHVVNNEAETDLSDSANDLAIGTLGVLQSDYYSEHVDDIRRVVDPWKIRMAYQAAVDRGGSDSELARTLKPFLS